MLKTFSSRSPRALIGALIATMVTIAPLPLSVSHTASAAAIPVASGTWSQGNQIQLIFGYSLATANPPALTTFDVRVDDIANPVTAISYLPAVSR